MQEFDSPALAYLAACVVEFSDAWPEPTLLPMESGPGTYALILRSRSDAKVQVGRWGHIHLEPGYYIYVGSALGPGGVRARVSRHHRRAKPKHWHIDYLREFLIPVCVWYSHQANRLEHRWAKVFTEISGMSPIQGFGCSDCKCYSHLFHTPTPPKLALFSTMADCAVRSWGWSPAC